MIDLCDCARLTFALEALTDEPKQHLPAEELSVKTVVTETVIVLCDCDCLTFALEALTHQPEQHLPAEVAEVRRLVRVNVEHVRPDL